MPNQTFFNLPEEKRERITEAAIREFSAYPFAQVSIARIIEQAGIPRGSFYQYFKNLKDLYKYIFKLAIEKKLRYFEDKIPELHGDSFDFFKTLRKLFVVGIEFAQEHPELLALGDRFIKDINLQLREEVLAEQNSKSLNIYGEMLRKGYELGQLDPAMDFTAALLMMQALNIAFTDAYLSLSLNSQGSILEDSRYQDLIDKMLYLLAHGLEKRVISNE
ncbi:transcriptional regulator [Desulfitobacterium dichloroeliminans LMG P-21439]|uniref:Transcriptional regulator n=1 Tax=Desulfitobacterium dichloroeliminans (strain LMG P-21439 / DCA1) TaxID=871963 RepID=L0FDK3_DESDL|nr:TetR/AcrR family transcriptional regulator [Desulfitobacterium dichloroeliminans]AGA70741.1 transcriptional regulator [Desulfitobacterium dichloroeliminans LMG P-21439]